MYVSAGDGVVEDEQDVVMIVEHIKRCYLIPAAVGIALLILLLGFADAFLFRYSIEALLYRSGIDLWLFMPVSLAFIALLYIVIADIVFIVINRRTVIPTVLSIVIFFVLLVSPAFAEFFLILIFVGIAGVASAFVNGRTPTAVVSGSVLLAPGTALLVFALGDIISNRSLVGNVSREISLLLLLLLLFTGGGILAVAFITHTYTSLSKLRILYLIPLILLVPFLMLDHPIIFKPWSIFTAEFALFLTGVGILTGGGILAFAFIAHSNMELHKKALYSIQLIFLVPFLLLLLATWSFAGGYLFAIEHTLWQLLRFLIIAGCIMMGINGVIYPNDPSIAPHKDSLELK